MASSTTRGLSAADINLIRSTLSSGRKPKVVFTSSAGQIAGQSGQVVDLLDPASDEWVVVRFGRDELPFAPADLAIPPRAPAKRAGKKTAPARRRDDEPTGPARRAADPKPAGTVRRHADDEEPARPASATDPPAA